MARTGNRAPELAIPVASLAALRNSLTEQLGADAAAHALRAAGHAAGDALFPQLMTDGEEVSQDVFWRRLAQLFASRGWGSLAHEDVHPGVGALSAGDWVEADANGGAQRPTCHFTTGMLANLLGNAAGSELAVMESECRSAGADRCRFLFGSVDALRALHGRVAAGTAVEAALAEL